ncbi:TRADD-N-associated membrane domain-containing protein [Segetibacter aerophilus]|uniref:Cyanobacterial TRADD-N associated 2 transmembrane domain-containing protein n=1 Tax=Segetibacter aerophilus TaxID=670293 RepID=A0A512BHT0_9BACT|nr:hypothetical protein [Segetibacter aerophilus]GEO11534.1 hypothetical protein SAE01_40300 [Segetibacter aerophilus]
METFSIPASNNGTKHLKEAKNNCEEIAKIPAGKTNEIGANLQAMIISYYQDCRRQAQQSFYCALGAAVVGTVFFIVAIALYNRGESYKISIIAGGLIQVISGINFHLYGKAARQFSSFHICLERTNRYLIANCICDNIDDQSVRDQGRRELIEKMSNAPMLTLEMVTKGKSHPPKTSDA